MTPRRAASRPLTSLFDRPVGLIRSSCPLGRLELTSDGTAVTSLSLERNGELPHDGYVESPLDVLLTALEQVSEYFAGSRRNFDVRLSPVGTPFQLAVWTGLGGIGFGAAKTYGQLGHDIGAGLAGRAIGSAVRANRLPLLIPCHRVLAAGGRITGYTQGSGVSTKQWLLDHEGIDYRPLVSAPVWQSAAV
ncbi:methylated-DNA-[protein]-cysteine S-methyltransferase [Okibacterium sp. HSC-33S16]|uniref:methylated-DNA--[protein]-cysteine S-methyltransferase n=1 Tax=Okibacterium sp. HSC-33S16 TaxID=2910965 RepID=UPI00209C716C|nr:methylated-DNA--[protein]-cysteine S-methyltransferase [Okibacterium sp. HSC-33S16]MCP2031819.1 methylated-DNA-[protein]-cysteine S-methyltransferase [Okibacterium sp. HSC-33S16]